jgi:LysR family transcriptional regulator, glycine cleavage system transcriptional activator
MPSRASRRLPPLNALRAFEAVARHQSISAAADELCVTHSAVSRHVAKLEDYLGVKLFTREHQRLSLNVRGAEYASRLTSMFDGLERLTADSFKNASSRFPLRVCVYRTYASRVLIPRLARFQAAHPEIEFQLETRDELPQNRHMDVDVSIALGTGEWPDVDAAFLCAEQLLPVASPKLLSGRTLTDVHDLREFTLLHAVPRLNDWAQWFALMGAGDIDAYRGMRFDTSGLAYQAAINELGVAMAQTTYVAEDMEEGRLVAVFSTPLETERAFYALFAPAKRADPGVLAFTEWLRQDLAHFGAAAAHSSI